MYYLGIDTSAYTTSVAVVNGEKKLICQKRRLLEVPMGDRGLLQSQAVFQHVQQLPSLLAGILKEIDTGRLMAIAASIAPRPVAGSYMPVFTVSKGQGEILAAARNCPFVPTTHQEGHIEAAVWSSGIKLPAEFLAVHLSGGTSELLLVKSQTKGYSIELLGGTKDLHAGQFVDRVGVSLGLTFPAGPQLESLAVKAGTALGIPSFVEGYDFSFSGPESHAQRLIRKGAEPANVARAVEQCIATTLEKVIRQAVKNEGIRHVLLAGGVSANSYIRQRMKQRLEHPAVGARLVFAAPQYSTDNAVGIALLGLCAVQGV